MDLTNLEATKAPSRVIQTLDNLTFKQTLILLAWAQLDLNEVICTTEELEQTLKKLEDISEEISNEIERAKEQSRN